MSAPAWGDRICIDDGVFRLAGQRLLEGAPLELRLPGGWVTAIWCERPPRLLLRCGGYAAGGRETGPLAALEPFEALCLRHAPAVVRGRRGGPRRSHSP